MNLERDTRVKVFLSNGTVVEGIVGVWTSDEVILMNGKGDLLLINKPLDNIMMTQVHGESLQPVPKPAARAHRFQVESSDQFSDEEEDVPVEKPRANPFMDAIMRAKKKTTERHQPSVGEDKYELPNFAQRRAGVGSTTKNR